MNLPTSVAERINRCALNTFLPVPRIAVSPPEFYESPIHLTGLTM